MQRPLFGWLLMLAPLMLMPIVEIVSVQSQAIACSCMALLLMLAGLSIAIGWRLAQWRYGVYLQTHQDCDTALPYGRYVFRMALLLTLTQLMFVGGGYVLILSL